MEQRKVLIVDDEPDIREILNLLLSSNGYEVFSSADGENAIKILKEEPTIDLIILDIMMPHEDGVQVLRKIREFSTVPALFLTAKITNIPGLNKKEIKNNCEDINFIKQKVQNSKSLSKERKQKEYEATPKVCKNCGAELKKAQKFCMKCGTKAE